MADRQGELFSLTNQQRTVVRKAQLPAVRCSDGKNVSGAMCKRVLLLIDSYAGKASTCWAADHTLASDLQISERSLQRAMQGLRRLGVLEVSDPELVGGRWRVHRRINWCRLMEYVPEGSSPGETAQPAPETAQPARDTAQPGCGRMPPLKPPSNATKGPCLPDGIPRGRAAGGFSIELGKGWRLQPGLMDRDLAQRAVLERLYATAVELDLVAHDPHGLLLFVALCCYCRRLKRTGRARSAVGLLHSFLDLSHMRKGRESVPWWDRLANRDEDEARALLRVRRPAVDHGDDFEQRRAEAIKALQTWGTDP